MRVLLTVAVLLLSNLAGAELQIQWVVVDRVIENRQMEVATFGLLDLGRAVPEIATLKGQLIGVETLASGALKLTLTSGATFEAKRVGQRTPAATGESIASNENLLGIATVESAIRAGQAGKYSHLTSDCVAIAGFGANMVGAAAGGAQPLGSYYVTVSGAEGLIASLAQDAKRLYKPFDVTAVTPELRRLDSLYVSAVPAQPKRSGNTFDYAPPIESVALKSKIDKNAFAPAVDLKITPQQWKNLLGGTIDGTSAVAQFNISHVQAFPPGDFDVVLVTAAGERRCKVGAKDRLKILPPR